MSDPMSAVVTAQVYSFASEVVPSHTNIVVPEVVTVSVKQAPEAHPAPTADTSPLLVAATVPTSVTPLHRTTVASDLGRMNSCAVRFASPATIVAQVGAPPPSF